MVLSLETETDFISLQMNMGPVIGMLVFKIATFLIFIVLVFLSIGYIKKSFNRFLVTQKDQYRIMSLLGSSLFALQIFYTLQVTIFSLFVISLGTFLGNSFFILLRWILT